MILIFWINLVKVIPSQIHQEIHSSKHLSIYFSLSFDSLYRSLYSGNVVEVARRHIWGVGDGVDHRADVAVEEVVALCLQVAVGERCFITALWNQNPYFGNVVDEAAETLLTSKWIDCVASEQDRNMFISLYRFKFNSNSPLHHKWLRSFRISHCLFWASSDILWRWVRKKFTNES